METLVENKSKIYIIGGIIIFLVLIVLFVFIYYFRYNNNEVVDDSPENYIEIQMEEDV